MKYLKMLGLMALSLMALFAAFAGSAPATILTSPQGVTYKGAIRAEAPEGIAFHGPVTVGCKKSTWEAEIENQGSGVTATGKFKNLTFTECGSATISVIDLGTLEIHTDTASANGNGIMTSSGAEITSLLHYAFLGTIHCITETENTPIGTITGSTTTEGPAETDPGPIPDPTDAFCSESVELTSNYTITTPSYLDID